MIQKFFLTSVVLFCVLNMAGWYLNFHNQQFNCTETQAINIRIQAAERQFLAQVGEKGPPKPGAYAGREYYLAHPKELKFVRQQAHDLIKKFEPASCQGYFH